MPDQGLEKALAYFQSQAQPYREDLDKVLSIPSISSDPERAQDVRDCAQHIKERLVQAGLEGCRLLETGGHPAVYGQWLHKKGAPTVLLYGHHDVQPVEPLGLWESPPFEPTERDGELYARGSVDDKGQVYMHIHALESLMRGCGELPLNVKMIVEGEEEIGSPNLESLLRDHGNLLDSDFLIISDTPMYGKGYPSLCLGLRGLTYLEVRFLGPKEDLHSGTYGGLVENPAMALARVLAALKDKEGVIQIPGFYDKVRPQDENEKKAMEALPFDPATKARELGVGALAGEKGYSPLERLWARPTLDVNGMDSGHTGPGAKTIIPSRARAKLSLRLVPDQDPLWVTEAVEARIRELAPPTVGVEIERLGSGPPFLADPSHPAYSLASQALERVFKAPCVRIREGGSIPMVSTLAETMKKPCLLLGFGLPDENAHAPNERLNLENYSLGTQALIHCLWSWGKELSADT